ncbi:MAG: COX15/CtaA family protein [Blastocatellia bacterium]
MKLSGFAKFAWGVLTYNVLVILWGAYVRATGSGAGCGEHWPLCNGQVLPRAESVKTMIEFSHRASSGLLGLIVLALLIWAMRAYPKKHPVRTGAIVSSVFIIIEALLGAVLVKFRLVDNNDSVARAVVMSLHLINTMILTAALALTAWWAAGAPPVRIGARAGLARMLGAGLLLTILLAVTGAIVALGDTLFRAESQTLLEGIRRDFSPTAHFLIQLRIIHPIFALLVTGCVIVIAVLTATERPDKTTVKLSRVVIAHFAAQVCLGLLNLVLQAPNWMQMLHLLMANAVWISLVLFAASALRADEALAESPVGAATRGPRSGAAEADPLYS